MKARNVGLPPMIKAYVGDDLIEVGPNLTLKAKLNHRGILKFNDGGLSNNLFCWLNITQIYLRGRTLAGSPGAFFTLREPWLPIPFDRL
jgi:hypothetical protein